MKYQTKVKLQALGQLMMALLLLVVVGVAVAGLLSVATHCYQQTGTVFCPQNVKLVD